VLFPSLCIIRGEDLFLEIVIRDVGLGWISWRSIRVQINYMKRCLFLGPSMSIRKFVEFLKGLIFLPRSILKLDGPR
jgi:hypothetical protein